MEDRNDKLKVIWKAMRSREGNKRESIQKRDESLKKFANIPDEIDPEDEFQDDC